MDKQKNILIIGGNSYLAQHFIAAYKNTFHLKSVSRKKTNFENEFIVSNLFDVPESLFHNIDVVINFAAIVHQPQIKDASIYELINYQLPLFLAKMALKNACSHFIQLSTIAVYGNTSIITKETPCLPNNDYGVYKLKADQELGELANDQFTVTSIRPSMVYGGYNAPGNMNSLIRLVGKNIPLPFKGIHNKRQFLNVHHLTQAINGIILQKLSGIIVIADEEVISTEELVEIISKAQNHKNKSFKFNLFWKIIKTFIPEIAHKLIDDLVIQNTYYFEELGIGTSYSVEDGIKEMIKENAE